MDIGGWDTFCKGVSQLFATQEGVLRFRNPGLIYSFWVVIDLSIPASPSTLQLLSPNPSYSPASTLSLLLLAPYSYSPCLQLTWLLPCPPIPIGSYPHPHHLSYPPFLTPLYSSLLTSPFSTLSGCQQTEGGHHWEDRKGFGFSVLVSHS